MPPEPSPTRIRISPGLETVTDLVLVVGDEHAQAPPVQRYSGPRAVRAALVGELLEFRAARDLAGERECCLELAGRLLDDELDVSTALDLTRRALDLQDDRALREELVEHLAGVGRHVEAAQVLMGGSGEKGSARRAERLTQASRLFARAGDGRSCQQVLQQAAALTPEAPAPQERLAAMSHWAPRTVSSAEAANAWLAAAALHPPDSEPHVLDLARACSAAPEHRKAALAFAAALRRQGLVDMADEVLRAQACSTGVTDDDKRETTTLRVNAACTGGAYATAIGAAFDSCTWGLAGLETRSTPLLRLLKRPEVASYVSGSRGTRRRVRSGLTAAARTRSPMGRAAALVKLARKLHADVRGMLLALATESYVAAGNLRRALDTAREACRVAPWSARAIAALVSANVDGQVPAATLERALGMVPVRGTLLQALAARLAAEHEPRLALSYARRWLVHSAGQAPACRQLLELAARLADPELLAAAVGDVLDVAAPAEDLTTSLVAALQALADLDADRALALCRQTINTLGPGEERLWNALRDLCRQLDDHQLEHRLLIRRAASAAVDAPQRARLLLRAAELCLERNDAAAAAVHLCGAAANAADLDQLLAVSAAVHAAAEHATEQKRSDCLIALAHADAWTAEQQDTRSAVAAWRRLGAMRWDLASDRLGAEEAYFIACSQEPDTGPYRYAADLCDRAGAADAIEMIAGRAERLGSDDQYGLKGRLLAAAGRLAAEHGLFDRALELSVAAVQLDPFRNDAVAVVERVADGEEGVRALNLVYDILASSALGRFGVRAAHYRAARQLEQRGAHGDALRHAVSAFEAVPGEGACYALLLRLANRCDDDAVAVRSMASVAASGTPDSRIGWLKRAATLASHSPQAPELRFDLFLTAFAVDPNAETVELLSAAMRTLLEHSPDDEVVEIRFERALFAAMPRLAGPRGAYTAVALAELAARTLGSGRLAALAIQHAIEVDPHGGGYAPMMPLMDVLAADEEAAIALLESIQNRRQGRYGVDPSLEALADELSARLGDRAPQPPSTATDEPEDHTPSPQASYEEEDHEPPPTLALDTGQQLEPSAAELSGIEPPAPGVPAAVAESGETAPHIRDRPTPHATPSDEGPHDADAEEDARQRGDHEAVAVILAARARATADLNERRYIRLRRAAVLEQRLGRLDAAAAELETILEEVGDDPTTLRYLADLHDRRDQPVQAARLWLRAAKQARSDAQRLPDLVRSCESLLAAGDTSAARRVFDALAGLSASTELLTIREELAQRLGDPDALADVLDQRASLAAQGENADIAGRLQPAPLPAEAGVGATPLAQQLPSTPTAEDETDPDEDSRTTDVASGTIHAVLEACRLDYRLRGAGTPHEAQRTIDKLGEIRGLLSSDQRDLYAFLYAEALDAVEGEEAAVGTLRDTLDEHGATPLAAIALAERLVRMQQPERALRLYAQALEGPAELHGVRSRGQVALDAASAAFRLMRDDRARGFLEQAVREDDTMATARQRLEEWFSETSTPGPERGDAAVEQAAPSYDEPAAAPEPSQPPPRKASAPPPLEPAPDQAPSPSPAPRKASAPPPLESAPEQLVSPAAPLALDVPEIAGLPKAPVVKSASATGGLRSRTLVSEPFPEESAGGAEPDAPTDPRAAPEVSEQQAREEPAFGSSRPELSGPQVGDLYRELVEGSYQAGEYLIALFEAGVFEGTTAETLTVRYHQAAIRKGDPTCLARLEEAARADQNEPYAQAVRHVMHAFDPEQPGPPAPALADLTPQPELTTRLLFSGLSTGVNEALAIVLDAGMFRKSMADYGLSGADRVKLGSNSVIGRAFTDLSSLLDARGTRLFRTSRTGPLEYRVALLSPLAAIVAGEAEEDSLFLHYMLGNALAATQPPCALAEALDAREATELLAALVAGFGPVGALQETTPKQVRLAEDLWHVVTSAAERRLREICADPAELAFERARRRARQACRRSGLFACGDLATAVRQAIDELGIEVRTPLEEPGSLQELCGEPAIADLVGLAIAPEYAEMRWHRQPPSRLTRGR